MFGLYGDLLHDDHHSGSPEPDLSALQVLAGLVIVGSIATAILGWGWLAVVFSVAFVAAAMWAVVHIKRSQSSSGGASQLSAEPNPGIHERSSGDTSSARLPLVVPGLVLSLCGAMPTEALVRSASAVGPGSESVKGTT